MLDGSLGSKGGNTAQILSQFSALLNTANEGDYRSSPLSNESAQPTLTSWSLKDQGTPSLELLTSADAFVLATGTYWDSWGSPLQKFFEDVTHLEGHSCFVGKPAALITTMHSVGGKEVLNRLHGVLNSFGLFIPPMCGFTYSFANHLALQNPKAGHDDFADDLWRLEDLETVSTNLRLAHELGKNSRACWSTWLVDREDANRLWLQDRPSSRR